MYRTEDRIIAQATARGSGKRGIIRLSGPEILNALLFSSESDPTGEDVQSQAQENKKNRVRCKDLNKRNPVIESDRILQSCRTSFDNDELQNSNFESNFEKDDDFIDAFSKRFIETSQEVKEAKAVPFFEADQFDFSADQTEEQGARIITGRIHPWSAPRDHVSVPCRVYYWSRGGFTGEPALELHLPGSQPILDAVIRRITRSGLARLADRGEFTLRAFLGGRIDLTQAEAILGVIDSEDNNDLSSALTQLAGGLAKPLEVLRESLMATAADLEAGLDFTEEDIEFISRDQLRQQLDSALEQIRQIENKMDRREGIDEEPEVILWGLPNSGKSSLFNAIVQRCSGREQQEALVSPIAGTTRDYLEFPVRYHGLNWKLIDTAGITDDITELDKTGVLGPNEKSMAAAKKLLKRAGIILLCVDISRLHKDFPQVPEKVVLENQSGKTVCLLTKTDLVSLKQISEALSRKEDLPQNRIATSTKNNYGIENILEEIARHLAKDHERGEVVPATAVRCRDSLHLAALALQTALDLTQITQDDVIIAAELRTALDQLGLITGVVHTDDLLDRIFSRFCIGK